MMLTKQPSRRARVHEMYKPYQGLVTVLSDDFTQEAGGRGGNKATSSWPLRDDGKGSNPVWRDKGSKSPSGLRDQNKRASPAPTMPHLSGA